MACAPVSHVVEQLVHVDQFLGGMFAQEGGAAAVAGMVAPGAHLQVQIRRILLQGDLVIRVRQLLR